MVVEASAAQGCRLPYADTSVQAGTDPAGACLLLLAHFCAGRKNKRCTLVCLVLPEHKRMMLREQRACCSLQGSWCCIFFSCCAVLASLYALCP